jgi:hypothetical protein
VHAPTTVGISIITPTSTQALIRENGATNSIKTADANSEDQTGANEQNLLAIAPHP